MMEAKIAPWKTHVVANVVELLKTPGTLAIIDTAGVPADLWVSDLISTNLVDSS